MNDPLEEKKRRRRERRSKRYAEEPEFREKAKAASRVHRLKNKDAINAERRHKYATEPEIRANILARCSKSRRKINLKTRYGMSLEEYAAMVAHQNGVCVICLKVAERGLVIDHDHNTRKLRSLLCDKCNIGLGHYNDDAAAMRRGADYLDYWQWRHADPHDAGPPPIGADNQHGLLAPSPRTIKYPAPKGEDMTRADDTIDESKTSRMMRRAILHELHQPLDPDEPPPADKLQAVARALVNKATQGDMTAVKETLDRIDGKTPAVAPASAVIPSEVFFTWQRP